MASPSSLLELAVDLETLATADRASAPKRVEREDWMRATSEFFEPRAGYDFVETPDEEMREIERLLGMQPNTFSTPYVIKTKIPCCPGCGRRNTFLDVVKTGLRVHKPEFLRDVFTGKHGHIVNGAPSQRCECYACGAVLPGNGTKYSAPKPVDPAAQASADRLVNAPQYVFPVYTYNF